VKTKKKRIGKTHHRTPRSRWEMRQLTSKKEASTAARWNSISKDKKGETNNGSYPDFANGNLGERAYLPTQASASRVQSRVKGGKRANSHRVPLFIVTTS